MKTAEEWRKIISGHSLEHGYYTDVDIKAIQQVAFLSGQLKGMLDAAEICNNRATIKKTKSRGRCANS